MPERDGRASETPEPAEPGGGRRVGIATKLLLGFGAMAALVVILAVANLTILDRINAINTSILEGDVPVLDAADRMVEEVLDEELYARRAAILGSEELMKVSRYEAQEFQGHLARLEELPDAAGVERRRVRELHEGYSGLLAAWYASRGGDAEVGATFEARVRRAQEELIGAIKAIAHDARERQLRRTEQTAEIGAAAYTFMAAVCAAAVLLGALATVLLTRSIARPIGMLKAAAGRIAAGRFDVVSDVRRGDELGDLSRAFAEMARRLKRLEEMYLDASPLTRLPGNIAIENVLRKRLERGAPLVFCLVDLDNFKAFNDRYGYARGSELIKATARVIEQAVRECGDPGDFVGHIGGDDFVVITTPERYRGICTQVIAAFDGMIGSHFDPEDRQRRFVVAKNRQGEPARYPITTISIAVVTNTERAFESPIQIGEVAADLKEYAKSLEGSVFVVDRRRREAVNGRGAVVAFPKTS